MKRVLVCWLLASCWQQTAYAWGDQGHRITGYIANAYLSDTARIQLRALVGTDDLAQIATWMDDERETLNRRLPGSSRWHYENRAVCGESNGTVRNCPQGQCITRQIERSIAVLQNRGATTAQRTEAVRILVHLLGDLHQPLHLIDNGDRGGNEVWVQLPRERNPRRLHEVWDTQLVRMNSRFGADDFAAKLVARFHDDRVAWQAGSVDLWAINTFTLAKTYVYTPLPGFVCRTGTSNDSAVIILPASYIQSARSVVDTQLAKAGVRIALVLNGALDGTFTETFGKP